MPNEMENEFMKRGYLLPKGCKDLSDVLKPKAEHMPMTAEPPVAAPLPPSTGEMAVPSKMTVKELAAALSQKPYRIIANLLEIGVFATLSHQLDFDAISRVVRKYGFIARRAD